MRSGALAICLMCLIPMLSCGGKRPSATGKHDAGLAPCPSSPNCVSSDSVDAAHRVDAFVISIAPGDAWPIVREEVQKLPRTTIVEDTATYLHVECRSALFRFVDDLELSLDPPDGLISVRSASRVGHSDLGVNRRRVERLREALRARGVVR